MNIYAMKQGSTGATVSWESMRVILQATVSFTFTTIKVNLGHTR